VVQSVYSDKTVSVSEFKRNPSAVLREAEGETLAVLNRNQVDFYAVPAKLYEQMALLLEDMEDREMAAIALSRMDDPTIPIDIDDL